MTAKRFRVQEHCLRSSYGIEAENWLVTNDNHSVVLNDKAEAHMVANMGNDVINEMNALHEENIQLKKSYDITEQVNDALSKENEELHQIQQELADENRLLRKEYNTMLDLVLDSGIDYVVCDELEDLE